MRIWFVPGDSCDSFRSGRLYWSARVHHLRLVRVVFSTRRPVQPSLTRLRDANLVRSRRQLRLIQIGTAVLVCPCSPPSTRSSSILHAPTSTAVPHPTSRCESGSFPATVATHSAPRWSREPAHRQR